MYRGGFYARNLRFVPRSLGNPLAIAERKYYDMDHPYTLVSNSGTDWNGSYQEPNSLLAMTVPQQGDGFSQRIGRQIQFCKFSVRGAAHRNGVSGSPLIPYVMPKLRVIIFIDMQTNASRPTGLDVMQSAGNVNPIFAFQNPNNFGRFKVLKDKTFTFNQGNPWLSSDGGDHYNGQVISWFWQFTFKPYLRVHFNGTNSGSVTDIIDNSIHCIALSETGVPVYISYKARFCYYDV